MKKLFTVAAIALTALFISGCTCVGTHQAKVEGGTRSTSGLFSFNAVDNGFPMIPLYSKFTEAE